MLWYTHIIFRLHVGVIAMAGCRSLTSLEVETHTGSLSEFPIMVVNKVRVVYPHFNT
jgi:hypothetical protein